VQVIDKDLQSIQEVRILLENAAEASLTLKTLTQDELDEILESLFSGLETVDLLQNESLFEGRYGTSEDEVDLCQRLTAELRQYLKDKQYVGIVDQDTDNYLTKIGVPLGVIGVILPKTTTVAMVVNIALIALKSGNTVVFVPHRNAISKTAETVELLNDLAAVTQLPEFALACVKSSTNQSVQELLASPKVSLVLNLGCSYFTTESYKTVKPVIYGDIGSSPVFVEKTADIVKAVEDIVASRSFNHGLMPGAEQFLIVETSVSDEVRQQLPKSGAYLMSRDESQRLAEILFDRYGKPSEDCVGKSAIWLAKRAGFDVPTQTRVLVAVHDYMYEADPYARAVSSPVIVFYQEPDWRRACEKCIEILTENHMCHTLTIHSKNSAVIQEYAIKKPVGRMVVNGPASFGATGLTSQMIPSLILGGVTTGRGFSAANISPSELTYQRYIAFTCPKETSRGREPVEVKVEESQVIDYTALMNAVWN
jgi:acyl-CoA reductase-like NAD-dependent aldehyde dehydrogenase